MQHILLRYLSGYMFILEEAYKFKKYISTSNIVRRTDYVRGEWLYIDPDITQEF
jgi:hypothetical protein